MKKKRKSWWKKQMISKSIREKIKSNPPNSDLLNWATGEADKLGMTLSMSVISRRGTQHWVFKCSATGRMLLSYYPKTKKGFRPGGKLYDIGDEMAAVGEARSICNSLSFQPSHSTCRPA